jgi:hypothetical protein
MNLESGSAISGSKTDQSAQQHQQFRSAHINAEVGNFLERFSAGDGSAVGHEAAVAAEKSFGAFTPLNVSLLPLLSRHQQLQAQRHLNQLTSTHHHITTAPPGLSPLVVRTEDGKRKRYTRERETYSGLRYSDPIFIVTSMALASQLEPVRDLRDLSRSAMESLMRNNGPQLLERLEQMFQLVSPDTLPLLSLSLSFSLSLFFYIYISFSLSLYLSLSSLSSRLVSFSLSHS